MKRKTIAALLMCAMLLSLAACGGKSSEDNTTQTETADMVQPETVETLHENLMRYRIRMALVLLENTELPVEEISTATGFCTASHSPYVSAE